MVHHYFMQSPFFDLTSNNAALRTQAQFNPALIYLLQSREAFESRLRTIQGLEFIVVGEPKDVNGSSTSVWNIRKQYRRKAPGSEDELSVLGTYFIVGENVYQAPCLEDVLTSRLLSTTTALTRFLSSAATLPSFSPAKGYSYQSTSTKTETETEAENATQTDLSAAITFTSTGDPINSSATQSNQQGSQSDLKPSQIPKPADSSQMQQASAKDTRLLFDAFDLARRYGHEYIDQNPLQGEPGSFVFSSTHEQLRTRQKQEELVRLKALKEAKPSAPPALQVDTKAVPTARKGSEAEISPKTATTAAGKLKRRKSKAPVTPTES